MINFVADFGEIEAGLDAIYNVGYAITDSSFTRKASTMLAQITRDRFELHVDNLAREAPKKYHHVYEWGPHGDALANAGNPDERLFFIDMNSMGAGTRMELQWRDSTEPSPFSQEELAHQAQHGYERTEHVFEFKAQTMEFQEGADIEPLDDGPNSWLFWVDKDGPVFTKYTRVTYPTQGNFTTLWNVYWGGGGAERLILDPVMEESTRKLSARATRIIAGNVAKASSKSVPKVRRGMGRINYLSKGRPLRRFNLSPKSGMIKSIRRSVTSVWRAEMQ